MSLASLCYSGSLVAVSAHLANDGQPLAKVGQRECPVLRQ